MMSADPPPPSRLNRHNQWLLWQLALHYHPLLIITPTLLHPLACCVGLERPIPTRIGHRSGHTKQGEEES